jgi:zinc D-Ala-D-Ala carboxypeptidase
VATVAVLGLFGLARIAGVGSGGGGEEQVISDTTLPESTTTSTVPAPPECADGDVPVTQDPATQWDSLIVDTERALPADYAPNDLVNVSEAGFPLGTAVRGFVIDDLRALREAAQANGTPISVIVGFRSYAEQTDLYNRRIEQMGEAEARSRVARAGHSEHQLGTAIDVTDEGLDDVDQQWGSTPAGQWIAANASQFGFVVSYPPSALDRTCFDYEPWHLRYVGRERAAEVLASGRTLREVLYALEQSGTPPTTAAPGTTAAGG